MCRHAKENPKERGTENILQETHFHYHCMKILLRNSNWKMKNMGTLELKKFCVKVVFIYISKKF
jgi:hypothetical protein